MRQFDCLDTGFIIVRWLCAKLINISRMLSMRNVQYAMRLQILIRDIIVRWPFRSAKNSISMRSPIFGGFSSKST